MDATTFETHPFRQSIRTVSSLIAPADAFEEDVRDLIPTIELVLADARAVESAPAWRVSRSWADELAVRLDALGTTIVQLRDKTVVSPPVTLDVVWARLDDVTSSLSCAPRGDASAAQSRQIVTAAKQLTQLRDDHVQAIEAKIAELSSGIALSESSLSDLLSKIDEAKAVNSLQVARLDSAIATFIDSSNNKLKEQEQVVEGWLSSLTEDTTEEADLMVEGIRQRQLEADELVGITSERVTSHDYESYAKKQERAAFGWAVTTVIVGVLAIALLVVLVNNAHESAELLSGLKALGSLGLLGVSWFTGNQVAHHQAEAKDARQIALTLKAAPAFVSQLTRDEQQEFRKELAEHVFRRPFSPQAQTGTRLKRDSSDRET